MGIYLRHNHRIPPCRWGSTADIQYAVKSNSEKIFNRDYKDVVLAMPLFWGFPIIDYSFYCNNSELDINVLSVDNSLNFPGDAYVRLKNTASLNPSHITIYAEIKTTATGDYYQICSKDYSNPKYRVWQFRQKDTNKLEFLCFRTGTDAGSAIGDTILPDGMLHRVAGTWDGTNIKVYVDGKIDGTPTAYAGALQSQPNVVFIGIAQTTSPGHWNGDINKVEIIRTGETAEQVALNNSLPYALYQKVLRPFYLLPATEGPWTEFYDLNTEISGGAESLQDLSTDIQANAEDFFDLQTEISATTDHTIIDLNTDVAAAFNISFEDLSTDVQAVSESLTDLNTDISTTAQPETIIDLSTDIQVASDVVFYDLSTDLRASERLSYDLSTDISVVRSKHWVDTEIEAASYASWSFTTEWNPDRFLNTEIAAKKPYAFSFKTETGSSYAASSAEVEILLSGYSWPLRTLFLDYLRVGTANEYNFELWWARGQSGKNPLRNAKIRAEYITTQFDGGHEVVTCDWLSCTIDGGDVQTINETPVDLGDMPCDSKLDVALTVTCRDCSLTRGLVFFRLIITGDYKESLYGAPVVYGDGSQYFEGEQDDYTSNTFISRLYVVG